MPNESDGAHTLPTLYGEHLALGAKFADGLVPQAYAYEESEPIDVGSDALLCDVSQAHVLLFSGAPAAAFATATFAGRKLARGECAFEVVLTGDGGIASVALLARTGEAEYIVVDPSHRAHALEGWLSFVAGVKQNGYAPYQGLQTQEVSAAHVLLSLAGPAATHVLDDYLATDDRLPRAGEVRACMLDRIPCIVVRPPIRHHEQYLLFVPPASAVVLWRSLLSFGEVHPVGSWAMDRLMDESLPWREALATPDVLRMPLGKLRTQGLARDGEDFIGARALGNEA